MLIIRGSFYLLLILLPIFHPGIAVPYDISGLLSLFVMIPMGMLVGFFFPLKKLDIRIQLALGLGIPLILSIAFLGLPLGAGGIRAGGLWAYGFYLVSVLSTWFLYHRRALWAAVLEPFLFGFLVYRLLGFFRSSEGVATQSPFMVSLYFFFVILLFLGHTLSLSLWIMRGEEGLRPKDGIGIGIASLVSLALALFLVRPDFVSHEIIENMLRNRVEPQPLEGDGIPELGQGESENAAPGEAELMGIPGESWSGNQSDSNKQYAVMIVHTSKPTVYLSGEYYGDFDPQAGFTYSRDLQYNELRELRLAEVWLGNPPREISRRTVKYTTFSTLASRYFPFTPRQLEPTVYRSSLGPFSYIHNGQSAVSFLDPSRYSLVREYSPEELQSMEGYLQTGLSLEDEALFREILNGILDGDENPGQRLLAILDHYGTYQYQLGFDEDVSLRKLRSFVLDTLTGDCTEFSNTTALLARMAGLPARVVTGYLASPGLQTAAHRQAVAVLQEQIGALQDYPRDELLMVTTAHRHSWTQVWFPDYGWVDVETTSTALPPTGNMDPNNMDLVIPIIPQQRPEAPQIEIPWGFIGWTLLWGLGIAFLGIYALKSGKMIFLFLSSKGADKIAAVAIYRGLLFFLANNGYPVKSASMTALDYSQEVPQLEKFARQYGAVRYRSRTNSLEISQLRDLAKELKNQLSRKDFPNLFLRIFRVKGLDL